MPRSVPAAMLLATLIWATLESSPARENSSAHHCLAKNPRSSRRGSSSMTNTPGIFVFVKIMAGPQHSSLDLYLQSHLIEAIGASAHFLGWRQTKRIEYDLNSMQPVVSDRRLPNVVTPNRL